MRRISASGDPSQRAEWGWPMRTRVAEEKKAMFVIKTDKWTKPTNCNDFIPSDEFLLKKGYPRPEKLGGTGTSAGGILISRAVTERPDLFRAAICNFGCAHVLRLAFSPISPDN